GRRCDFSGCCFIRVIFLLFLTKRPKCHGVSSSLRRKYRSDFHHFYYFRSDQTLETTLGLVGYGIESISYQPNEAGEFFRHTTIKSCTFSHVEEWIKSLWRRLKRR